FRSPASPVHGLQIIKLFLLLFPWSIACTNFKLQVVAHTPFGFLLPKTTTSVLKRIFDKSYKEDLKSHGRSAKLAFNVRPLVEDAMVNLAATSLSWMLVFVSKVFTDTTALMIKRYTNNFAEKLGQRGFGTVLKGKLPNEHLVAIKILDKSKHSQKQFMNEVPTLARIHHIHLVRLLGYCFQGSKRALVYDYMVNGSLEKYIHGDDKNALDWKQLHKIAMSTTRGISYLHEDCASQILHFDIKPHNVLLDATYCPKVADFGLAKLADREGSHISLTATMGTPGYAALEVWSKNLGPVTDRSDVYSYGMLVMGMVGGRKNFDMQASRESKLYYPEWAFKQVENGEFGRLRKNDIGGEEDESIAKMLSLLGLWCIQYNPSHRPAMSKVIKMLEGSIELSVPPLPFPVHTTLPTTSLTDSSSNM
ncbi:hypothetical protein KI387_038116, partial [Taxus chinensis]